MLKETSIPSRKKLSLRKTFEPTDPDCKSVANLEFLEPCISINEVTNDTTNIELNDVELSTISVKNYTFSDKSVTVSLKFYFCNTNAIHFLSQLGKTRR